LLQEPVRRPAGLPDRPLSNGRPRTRPGGFGETPSAIATSFCRRRSAALRCRGLCDANQAILWSITQRTPGGEHAGFFGRPPWFHPREAACHKSGSTVRMRKTSHLSFPAKAGTRGPVVSNFLSHRIAYRRFGAVEPWAPASAGEAIR
jgi:hypothetical protein